MKASPKWSQNIEIIDIIFSVKLVMSNLLIKCILSKEGENSKKNIEEVLTKSTKTTIIISYIKIVERRRKYEIY